MIARLLTLVQSKVALAALGVLLVGGSGAAVVTATHAELPFTRPQSASTASHTPDATKSEGDHAHTVSLEGKLTAYGAAGKTISVQTKDSSSPTAVKVDSNTRVDGEHASSLSDLAHAIGHDVEVQATKQSNGSMLAWKITVQGVASGTGDDSHGSGDTGDGTGSGDGHSNGSSDNGQQQTITGTISTVGANSFTVKVTSGSAVTVTVSGSTQFAGTIHGIGDLKAGVRVSIQGSLQSNGDLAATRIEVQVGN